MLGAPAQAQTEAAPAPRPGFSVREVTLFSSYYSQGLPPSLINSALPGYSTRYDTTFGGSAILAFARASGERTHFGLQYTPSYTRRVRYSGWSSLGNAVNMQFDHAFAPRLRFTIGAAGAIRNREELQFGSIAVANPSSGLAPGEIAGLPPLGDQATQFLVFGSRILTANVRTGVQYSVSPRLILSMGVSGSRTQYLRNGSNQQSQTSALIPRVTAFLGDVGITYNLSPRMSIGGTFDSARQQSQLQEAIITNGRVSIDRALTQYWSVNAYGGVGQFRSLRQTDPTPSQLQYVGGAGVAYRRQAHTLLAAFDRRASDAYGVGATSSRSVSGSWRWAPPTGAAWLALGMSRTEIQSLFFPATSLRGTAEIGRRLMGGTAIVLTYTYMGYSGLPTELQRAIGQHAVRVGFAWISHGSRPGVQQ